MQLNRSFGFGCDAKGFVGFGKLDFVDALFFSPGLHSGVAVEHEFFTVNGGEHADVHFFDQVHGLQRVVQALLGHKVFAESHGDAAHHHVFGGVLDPLLKSGLKGIAVGAAVPKKLEHFDLARASFGGHRTLQGDVVFAGAEGLLGPGGCVAKPGGHGQHDGGKETTFHDGSLSKVGEGQRCTRTKVFSMPLASS